MFSHDISENWSIQVHFFAYAHNTASLAHLHISSYETFFHRQPRIPRKFKKTLFRNQFSECTAKYCSDSPPHSHFQSIDVNSLFHSPMLKPSSAWFLAIETAMVQTLSKIQVYAPKKANSFNIQSKIQPTLTNHYR